MGGSTHAPDDSAPMVAGDDAPVRFGALLLPAGGYANLLERARAAETAGFDSVWIDDHIAHPARPADPWLECWTALAGLSQVTSRVRLGPLVSNIVLRHPALLASQALTVADLSGGRLDVGIGSGYAAADHAAVAEPLWSPRKRSERFEAAVALVRDRLGPDGATALTVAGHGSRAIATAARYGDTWVSYGGFRLPAAAAYALTRRRVTTLEDVGGARLGRRLLCGSAALTAEPIWRSLDAFEDYVGRYQEAGISEFAFHWPPAATNPDVDASVVEAVLAGPIARAARAASSGLIGRGAGCEQPHKLRVVER